MNDFHSSYKNFSFKCSVIAVLYPVTNSLLYNALFLIIYKKRNWVSAF